MLSLNMYHQVKNVDYPKFIQNGRPWLKVDGLRGLKLTVRKTQSRLGPKWRSVKVGGPGGDKVDDPKGECGRS